MSVNPQHVVAQWLYSYVLVSPSRQQTAFMCYTNVETLHVCDMGGLTERFNTTQ